MERCVIKPCSNRTVHQKKSILDICDTVIYRKSTYLVSVQFLAPSSAVPWNFLSNKSDGIIFGLLSQILKTLLGRRLLDPTQGSGLVAREPTTRWEGWNFPSHPDLGRGRGPRLNQLPMADDSINHAFVMKPA